MTKKYKIGLLIIVPLAVVVLCALFFQGTNFAVLNPKGTIAHQQLNLMIIVTLLMLLVVIPVFVLTFLISWRYRESNTTKKKKYTPENDSNHLLEAIWWGIPLIIIAVIAGITWKSSHSLDPYKPIANQNRPITVQVVSLNWKWLFIYPEQGIASVNYLQIPEDTPINFQLTSDGPMNSFWVPQLGGQIYTMAGMQTRLHLMATEPGDYTGQSANLSGDGFAGMRFTARATSGDDFYKWVQSTKESPTNLSQEEYDQLAQPSKNNPPALFTYNDKRIYDTVMSKYQAPAGSSEGKHGH